MSKIYIVGQLEPWSSITCGGKPISTNHIPNSCCGFMVCFDDYAAALEWAEGDASLVWTGEAHEPETEPKKPE